MMLSLSLSSFPPSPHTDRIDRDREKITETTTAGGQENCQPTSVHQSDTSMNVCPSTVIASPCRRPVSCFGQTHVFRPRLPRTGSKRGDRWMVPPSSLKSKIDANISECVVWLLLGNWKPPPGQDVLAADKLLLSFSLFMLLIMHRCYNMKNCVSS